MKHLKRLWRDQRGQSLVMYAGAILVTIMLAGAVIEIGMWNLQFHKAQQAADLAALSAAQYVPLSGAETDDMYGSDNAFGKTVNSGEKVYADNNGGDNSVEVDPLLYESIQGWNKVKVTEKKFHSWIILDEFIGGESRYLIDVKSVAKAEALYVPYATVPLALIKRAAPYEMPYDQSGTVIKGKLSSPSLGSANLSLGILDIKKTTAMNATEAIEWLANDHTGSDMKIAKETASWYKGANITPEFVDRVVNALNQRIDNGKKQMILPVFIPDVNGHVNTATINGYACFQLDSAEVVAGTTDLKVTGTFIKYIDTKSDRKPSSITSEANYFGVRVIYLDE